MKIDDRGAFCNQYELCNSLRTTLQFQKGADAEDSQCVSADPAKHINRCFAVAYCGELSLRFMCIYRLQ